MEEKIEEVRQRIADLRWNLEALALRRQHLEAEIGLRGQEGEEDHPYHELKLFALDIEEESLSARYLAASLKLAGLAVEAEIEKLVRQLPSPSVEQLAAHRKRLEEVLASHRKSAKQEMERALDMDIACERYNDGLVEPPKPKVQQEQQVHRQQYMRGPRP